MPDARNRCVCTIYSKSYSVTMDYKAKREFWYFNKMQFPSFPAILLPFFLLYLLDLRTGLDSFLLLLLLLLLLLVQLCKMKRTGISSLYMERIFEHIAISTKGYSQILCRKKYYLDVSNFKTQSC